jgi:hypothetical protein
MHPIVIVLVPLVLIVIGMVLNSIGLSFDQPPSSAEQDPTKRLTIERDTFRQFFDRQRSSVTKRQQRVGQYAWLLLIATAGSFIWLYNYTVDKTVALNRISSLQTLGAQEVKDLVLSVTLIDGSNVKYVIKSPAPNQKTDVAAKDPVSTEKVSSWELEKLTTAVSVGDSALPLGVALKIAN